MLQILATLTGSVLAGLGWTIQRGMRGDAVAEAITRRLKLVELYQRMRAAGLDARGSTSSKLIWLVRRTSLRIKGIHLDCKLLKELSVACQM